MHMMEKSSRVTEPRGGETLILQDLKRTIFARELWPALERAAPMRVEAQSPPSGFAFSPVIRMLGLFEAARANLMAAKIAQQDLTVTFDAIGIDFKELHSEHERLSVEHVRERRARQFQGMPVGKGFAHPIETLPRISDSVVEPILDRIGCV
jgi:hypothetical protein